jgi:hypothetical protein
MTRDTTERCVRVLLAIALLFPLLAGCGRLPANKVRSVSGMLNAESPSVGSDTLSLSMGAFPLSGEAKCEIRPVKAPALEGVDMQAFDFAVDTEEELLSVMELTIPYDEKALGGKRPDGNVAAAYYNKKIETWEPVSFRVNEGNGTVTIYTDHLSTYGCFIIKNENTRRAYAAYAIPAFALSAMHDYGIDADAIVTNTANSGGEPGADAIEAGLNILDTTLNIGSAGVDTLSHGFESLSGVTGTLKGSSLLDDIGNKLGTLGTACAVAQVAYGMYNVYNGDTDAIFPCYAEALKGGLSYAAGKAGSKLVSLAFLGVLCVEYSINEFAEAAWEGRQDIYERAYSLYYESPGVKRSARDWANEFIRARETASSPERYQLRIDGLVQRYVDQFWRDDEIVAAYQAEAQKGGFTGGGGLNERMKEEISAAYKNELFRGVIQDAFMLIAEKDARNAEKDLLKVLNEIRGDLNRVCTLEIYDGSLSADKTISDAAQMQAYVAVPDFVEDPDSWRTVIDDKGNGRIQFTVLGYLMAGAPGELSLYEKGASTSEGPAATVSFTMEDLVQRVDIGVSGPSLEEILGSYSGETDVLAMRVSDAGYEAYVNESEGDKVASRAECDAVLTELMQEEALTVSSITISSDDPASGRCTILVDVINTKGEPTPVSVEGTYKTGMLIVQGEHGESTIVVTKEPDGAIRLKSSETQLGLYAPKYDMIACYLTVSLDIVKTG